MATIGATYTIRGWPNEAIPFSGDLQVCMCPTCAIVYAIPSELLRRLRTFNQADYPKNYARTTCPNGHEWCKTGVDSEAARLRAELESERAALRWTQDELNKTAKTLKRTEKRIHAGVCPDCNRTFQNVARHMTTKHKPA